MFIINLVDKNDKKIELLKTKSQIDIDRFTTCFEGPEYLLMELGLDDTYKIEIIEYLKKEDEPKILNFTGSKYRNVIYNYNNIDYFKGISSLERSIYKTYFNNELLFQDTKKDKYSDKKKAEIYKIFEILKSNSSDYRDNLSKAVFKYFNDYYSAFKKFYKYIIEFSEKEELIYPAGTLESTYSLIIRMQDKISGKVNETNIDLSLEDNVDSIITNPLSEIDDQVSELDMFLDEHGISEEEKKRMLDNKIKKIN